MHIDNRERIICLGGVKSETNWGKAFDPEWIGEDLETNLACLTETV